MTLPSEEAGKLVGHRLTSTHPIPLPVRKLQRLSRGKQAGKEKADRVKLRRAHPASAWNLLFDPLYIMGLYIKVNLDKDATVQKKKKKKNSLQDPDLVEPEAGIAT